MGTFDEVKGKAKEALGDMTNNPDLQREGEAQAEAAQAEAVAEDDAADAAHADTADAE